MRWRLVLEEFGPELLYMLRARKMLSRLNIEDDREIFNIAKSFGFDDNDLPASAFPVCYRNIAKTQRAHPALQKKLASHKDCSKTTFCWGDKTYELTCQTLKIALPSSLQQNTVDWHHET
jgi:hypothetical protein